MTAEALQYPVLNTEVEAEIEVLAGILQRNEWFYKASALQAEDFSDELNAALFGEAMRRIADGQVVTVLTLKAFAEGLHPETMKYLAKLAGKMILGFESSVDLVKRSATIRRLQQIALSLAAECSENQQEPEDMAGNAMAELEAIFESGAGFTTSMQVTEKIIKRINNNTRPDSTGLFKLDQAMDGGLYAGKSYGFAARKKVGKTMFAATVSANLSRAGVKHLMICCEMDDTEIFERCLAREMDVKPGCFRGDVGKNPEFQQRMVAATQVIGSSALYRTAPGLTFDKLKRIMLEAVYRHKVRGVILDYWQLVGGKPARKSQSEHLDEVAQWIANFGRKHNVWNLVLAQINQDDNTRGGEGIRLAFDQVYRIHREDVSQPYVWMEMMDTRYTSWNNIGSEDNPGLIIHENGPYFMEA